MGAEYSVKDTTPCHVVGYAEAFLWPEGPSPAYLVTDSVDNHTYEFRPSDLLLYMKPQTKIVTALQYRLEAIQQGDFVPGAK